MSSYLQIYKNYSLEIIMTTVSVQTQSHSVQIHNDVEELTREFNEENITVQKTKDISRRLLSAGAIFFSAAIGISVFLPNTSLLSLTFGVLAFSGISLIVAGLSKMGEVERELVSSRDKLYRKIITEKNALLPSSQQLRVTSQKDVPAQ